MTNIPFISIKFLFCKLISSTSMSNTLFLVVSIDLKKTHLFQLSITLARIVGIGQFCSFLTSTRNVNVKKVQNCLILIVSTEVMSI